jgi:O-antigen ligase
LITLDDVRPRISAPVSRAPSPQPIAAPTAAPASADGFLRVCLYLCVLSGFFVSIQPAPYEGLVILLGFACLLARAKIDRAVMPMVILLTILQVAGLASALPVLDDPDVWNFMGISIYLALTAPVYAAVMTTDTVRRFSIFRNAIVLSATIAAVLGMIGYFQLIPQYEMFMMNARAVATFKDPNGFAPFLIPPLLLTLERLISGHVRPLNLIAAMLIAVGLLLSFSRGGWGNFTLSFAIMLTLLFITAPERAARKRIAVFVLIGIIVVGILFAFLYSIESVREMILERATLLKQYDTGTSGARFNIQEQAITEILLNPNGMGGWVFGRIYGLVPHNSYLGAFLNHGWIGGLAYIGLVLTTIIVGFRCALIRTPWQSIMIALYASYIGLAAESFIVDTDHGRLYYQLIGAIWGMIAATVNFNRSAPAATPEWGMTAPAQGLR